MITVGGSEAIDIAMRAMLDPGDEVLIPQPNPFHMFHVELTHTVPVIIELKEENEFRLTKEEVLEKITDKTKILFYLSLIIQQVLLWKEKDLGRYCSRFV